MGDIRDISFFKQCVTHKGFPRQPRSNFLFSFLICRASWLEKSTFFLRMSLADLPGDPKV